MEDTIQVQDCLLKLLLYLEMTCTKMDHVEKNIMKAEERWQKEEAFTYMPTTSISDNSFHSTSFPTPPTYPNPSLDVCSKSSDFQMETQVQPSYLSSQASIRLAQLVHEEAKT